MVMSAQEIDSMTITERAGAAKLFLIALLWLAVGRVLPELVWRILPDALLQTLSLPSYSMLCQIMTTGLGLGATRLVFSNLSGPLGVSRPSSWHVALATLLGPAVFVVASFLALEIAEPFLIAELAREGAGASRRNAGAFGKAITDAPLLITLAWGTVLAAVAEELAFRGALFTAIEKSALIVVQRTSGSERDKRARVASGVVAVFISAAAFGAMHADMSGSVGIVRVAAATFLGIACGTARLLAASVFAPIALHFVYNSVSLGLARGVFRGTSEPLLSVVPNRLLVLAGACGFLAIVIAVARRAARTTAVAD
jgi:membrane protease YdiL (CAAX protease family)